MSEPISRPLEPSEISRLAGGDAYRFEMLLSQKNQERALLDVRETIKELSAWQIDHDKKDEVRFTETNLRMKSIEKSIDGEGGVRSGVNDYEENKQQFIGMRKLVIGIVATIAAIGGGIIGLYEIIKLMSQKS